MKIGFIGTGVMGKSIVKHLLKAGHSVTVYNRTKAKAESLLEAGAKWAENPKSAAQEAEIVFTMVGYPQDVEEVYLGAEGILAHTPAGAVVIDLTTSSPELAERIADEAGTKGIEALDAPVSGGDIGAQNGTLSIMVGGNAKTFERVLPILSVFGENIILQGPAGAGQHTKMSNQVAIASTMIGTCEALAYAIKAGLDPEEVLRSISKGAAGSFSLTNLAPRMIADDMRPGFYIKHFIKDMKIAVDEAERMGLELPGLRLSLSIYEQLEEDGFGEKGTQALIRHYV